MVFSRCFGNFGRHRYDGQYDGARWQIAEIWVHMNPMATIEEQEREIEKEREIEEKNKKK